MTEDEEDLARHKRFAEGLRPTAQEEAAHAVAGVVAGLHLKDVTILAIDPGTFGRTRFDESEAGPLSPEMARNLLCSIVAGPIAVELYREEHDLRPDMFTDIDDDEFGAVGDRARGSDLAREVFGADGPRELASAEARAKEIVAAHADAIARVAEALLSRKTLTSSEVSDLLGADHF
jgi:hypothetical protein